MQIDHGKSQPTEDKLSLKGVWSLSYKLYKTSFVNQKFLMHTCIIPWTHNSFGNRSFAAADPRVWNSLPFASAHHLWTV